MKRLVISNIFDVGGEFKKGFSEQLLDVGVVVREKINDIYSDYFIKFKLFPIKLQLDSFKVNTNQGTHDTNVYAKIYPYGAILITMEILFEALNFTRTQKMMWIDTVVKENITVQIKDILREKYEEIIDTLSDFIEKDYKAPKLNDSYRYIFDDSPLSNPQIASLLINDPNMNMSPKLVQTIIEPNLACYHGEKIVITSSGAYVYITDTDFENILALMELSYTQAYELKVYDYILDEYIDNVYNEMEQHKFKGSLLWPVIFSGNYRKLIKRAISLVSLRVDIVDLVRDISNASKVTDDVYYSHIYSEMIKKLKLNEWYSNINIKINEIEKFNSILREENDTVREAKLEFWIIVLIIIEIMLSLGMFEKTIYIELWNTLVYLSKSI